MTRPDRVPARPPKAAGVYSSSDPDDIWNQALEEGIQDAIEDMRMKGTLPADFDDKQAARKSKSV